MKTFKKNWNGRAVQDDGAYMSKEAKSFVRAMKNMLKRELEPFGINVLSLNPNHYDCSGFLEKNGYYAYISYNIPRHGSKIDFSSNWASSGVLYREAKDQHDFRGGQNHFCSLNELSETLLQFIYKGAARKSFDNVQVGDHVICIDGADRDMEEHEVLVTSICHDDAEACGDNPNGTTLYGIDLTYGDCEESLEAVHVNEFVEKSTSKNQAFFFTFGSSEQFPFQGGYLIVNATDIKKAVETFRKFYPDKNKNTVNCAFIYNEKEWLVTHTLPRMDLCHEIIDAE